MPRSVPRGTALALAALVLGAGLCAVRWREGPSARTARRAAIGVHVRPLSRAAPPSERLPASGQTRFELTDHLDGRRDDPAYAAAWLLQQHEIIARQYGYAVNSLGLPPATAARVMDLLTERREAAADARDAAKAAGIEGPDVNLAVEQSIDAITDQIKGLIGSDAYYGSIEIAPTVSACMDMLGSAFGNDLAAKGVPLSNDQLYALAEAYVATNYAPGTQTAEEPDPATGLSQQSQAFLDRVSGTLNPVQVASIRGFLDRESQKSSALD